MEWSMDHGCRGFSHGVVAELWALQDVLLMVRELEISNLHVEINAKKLVNLVNNELSL